jgi:hypothetical protein
MDIREIFHKILKEEVAANAISGGGVDVYSPLLKIQAGLTKKRNKYNLTMTGKEKSDLFTRSGPTSLPLNSVGNSLDNGNKGPEQNPLDMLKKHDPIANARKIMKTTNRGQK